MKKKYINPEMKVTCVAVTGMINISTAALDTNPSNTITDPDDFGAKHREDEFGSDRDDDLW